MCGLAGYALPRIFSSLFKGNKDKKILDLKIFQDFFFDLGKIFLKICVFCQKRIFFWCGLEGAGCGLMRAGKNGCGPVGSRARAQPASTPKLAYFLLLNVNF